MRLPKFRLSASSLPALAIASPLLFEKLQLIRVDEPVGFPNLVFSFRKPILGGTSFFMTGARL
ncbi:MAG: hypothetical protein ACI8Q1_001079 [Parvicella sp.]|jgi:hypothetical protein